MKWRFIVNYRLEPRVAMEDCGASRVHSDDIVELAASGPGHRMMDNCSGRCGRDLPIKFAQPFGREIPPIRHLPSAVPRDRPISQLAAEFGRTWPSRAKPYLWTPPTPS